MTASRWAIPASYFSMVLGLTGLGNNWRVAARLWGFPAWIGEAVMAVGVAVWAVLAIRFAAKWLFARDDARAEIAHPILCCFVALAPVATMLAGVGVLPHAHAAGSVLIVGGAVGALLFGLWRHGGLWRGGRDEKTTTPVLYLPTVGTNLVSAIGMSALGWPEWGQLFFGAGVLAWIVQESIILGRLLTVEPLPAPLRPTLGIQMAPPAVSLLAYAAVTVGPPDLIARMLLGYALVQALMVARLLPWIRQPFTLSYWGFTFGVTAIATGTMRFAERGAGDRLFATLAPVLFAVSNVVVIGLSIASVLWVLRSAAPPTPNVATTAR
ncbi:dicarboxylate transporter/tellurite-resistance protein TehA [Mitsuaria sp. GD03876]|uniref:dicarboxylate transporter/tellurite-resistance protein TehA n=1 Tax=Mitsuaria sp. GD03876 TaxID=2975399 RepID=UPI00244BFCF7|nr:dicarboxylate transporter/tellurite-resistance protein TehA [Mitsuaria sp. GD03876]MDH0865429.1 dicarboxylate transporter/tellurite-resistance protein TehA [Mitsuaria sp. GD03876]